MSRFTGGWIKLHRGLADTDIASNINMLGIWVTLLMRATRFETTINLDGVPTKIPPGSVVFGIRELADRLKISKDTVYRWLKYLEKRDTIRITSDTRGTVVTICNWNEYQCSTEEAATPTRHLVRHDRDTTRPLLENKEERSNTVVPNKSKKQSVRVEYSKEFDAVWSAFNTKHIKGSKKRAYQVFQRLSLTPDDLTQLHTCLANYLAICKRADQITQHVSTFLNDDWTIYLEQKSYQNGSTSHSGVSVSWKDYD